MNSPFHKLMLAAMAVHSVLLASCGGGVHSILNPTGPQADRVGKIWWLMFYVCTGIFILVMVFLALAIARARARAAADGLQPEIVPSSAQERTKGLAVVSATTLSIIILFVFLIDSYVTGRGLTAELERKQAVVIELTGHQWWWEVRYQNVDASSIFTTANEIHIPVGQPITFSLRAADVIHSFWVPNLTGKKDLIPGKIATLWLQADKPGLYRGQCAEYCGLQHAHMALLVIAESREQFDAWMKTQAQSAGAPTTASQQRGQHVFLSTTCVMCHVVSGTQAGSNIGPNLTHFASRDTIGAATMQNSRDNLSQWIVDSQHVKPGNLMPQNNFSPEDLQALLDYLQSLK